MSDIENQIRTAVEGRRMPRNGDHRAIVTGPHLTTSLVELLARVGKVEATVEQFVAALVGPMAADPVNPARQPGEDPTEPLFPSLARKIVEISRTIERIEANLNRGIDTLR